MTKESHNGNRKPGKAARGIPADTTSRADLGATSARSEALNSIKNSIGAETGIRAGEIVGHRFWGIMDFDLSRPVLKSIHHANLWYPGKTVIGDPSIGEGIQAFKTAEFLWQYVGPFPLWQMYDGRMAYGTCLMWGEVWEHEKGYRSEFARVASINSVRDRKGDNNAGVLSLLQGIYNNA